MTTPQHSDDDIREAFARYVPEVASGILTFRKIAREHGKMTYVAVAAPASIRDPIGLLVGRRGAHLKAVISVLGGESVNIVRWKDEPREFIRDVLGLSRAGLPFQPVFRFEDSERRVCVTVERHTEELFAAADGLRLRLASELSGWQIILLCQDEPSVGD